MLIVQNLIDKLDATLHTGELNSFIPACAFGSDLMSDVLTLEEHDILLITGLANPQTIRTAEMADISLIIIVRGKEVTEEMIELAIENEITVLSSPFSMFKVCGLLYEHGLKPIY
jgi:predicted transcriptional regulator